MKTRTRKQTTLLEGFEVRTNKKGKAVYAIRDYAQGERVYRLNGKKLKPRFLAYTDEAFKIDLYNPLQINSATYMRLDLPSLYFNHSCEPNLGVRNRSDLYALRTIRKGEELTFDYATTMDESFECLCGSKRCRRTIGDFFMLPRDVQLFYLKHNALPNFIRKKLLKRLKS